VSPAVPTQEAPVRLRASVVIVSCNCVAALRRCLTALEASRGRQDFEIITVDAGSSDGSSRIDADFPGITVLRLPRNFGKTRARNIGVRTAQSDLIFFLDPHVEVLPDTVEKLIALLASRNDASAACPVLDTPEGAVVQTAFRLPTPAQLAVASLQGTPLPAAPVSGESVEAVGEQAILVRKTFIAGMNYLDEKRFSEHWSLLEVCWQIRNAGKKILIVPEARAILHPATPLKLDETLYAADRVSGAASFIAKHYGFGAGISFRVKCFFSALASIRMPLAFAILSGRRLDPTQ